MTDTIKVISSSTSVVKALGGGPGKPGEPGEPRLWVSETVDLLQSGAIAQAVTVPSGQWMLPYALEMLIVESVSPSEGPVISIGTEAEPTKFALAQQVLVLNAMDRFTILEPLNTLDSGDTVQLRVDTPASATSMTARFLVRAALVTP